MDSRLLLTAGSVGLESPVAGAEEVTGKAPVDPPAPVELTGTTVIAGTARRSCDPPANCIVESGSDRQSTEFSLDTNMPGSRVSMCVKLFDRPCESIKEIQRNINQVVVEKC